MKGKLRLTGPTGQKVLFMGLGASGKSSIKSVIFEGKSADDVKDYFATKNYVRSTKSLIGTAFQIFDCGGQESFISNFIGDQAEFIFSNVKVLVWVVDVSNPDNISTCKFYFDHAIQNLNKFSSDAIVFCLFHKVDLVLPDMKDQIIETLMEFFQPPQPIQISHHATSIFDQSIFRTFGKILQILVSQTIQARSVDDAIQDFMEKSQDLEGITVFTDEGLPIFTGGADSDKAVLPTNLWLASSSRIKDDFTTNNELKSIIMTDEYIIVFQRIKEELHLTGIAKKVAPLQYILVKMDELVKIVNEILLQRYA
jgi:GTPase SAR1 family protein